MDDCDICRREAGDDAPIGGWVLRTDHWSACVAEGFEAPGWLFLELRRHAEGPMAIAPDEAAAMGPLVAKLTGAIQEVTGAERVYVLAFASSSRTSTSCSRPGWPATRPSCAARACSSTVVTSSTRMRPA